MKNYGWVSLRMLEEIYYFSIIIGVYICSTQCKIKIKSIFNKLNIIVYKIVV